MDLGVFGDGQPLQQQRTRDRISQRCSVEGVGVALLCEAQRHLNIARYRNTLRRLHKVVAGLQEILQWPGSSIQYEQVEVVHRFAAAFYENMLIKPQEHHVPTGDERKAYRLYRQGSEMLDVAIKTRLFDEFSHEGTSPSSRSLSERSLMLLMAQYPRSRYTAETLIKYYLLEAFGRLCQVIDEN